MALQQRARAIRDEKGSPSGSWLLVQARRYRDQKIHGRGILAHGRHREIIRTREDQEHIRCAFALCLLRVLSSCPRTQWRKRADASAQSERNERRHHRRHPGSPSVRLSTLGAEELFDLEIQIRKAMGKVILTPPSRLQYPFFFNFTSFSGIERCSRKLSNISLISDYKNETFIIV